MMRRILVLLSVLLLMIPAAQALDYGEADVVGTVETLQKATNDSGNLMQEMALCDSIADAMRAVAVTDIAILNGGDVVHNLEGGEVTWRDIQGLFAVDQPLAVTTLTGAELRELLELGVSHAAVDMSDETLDAQASAFEGFPQVSGFKFHYDPSAPVGERIVELTLTDGTEIGADMTLTLCATEEMLSGGYGYPAREWESTGLTQAQALAAYIGGGTLKTPAAGRITCIGVSGRFAVSRPLVFLCSIGAILIVFSVRGALGKAPKRDKNPFFE